MTFIWADRVKETTTTTGTGNFALSGAVTGFQAFGDVMSNGDTTKVTVWNGSGEWETVEATYNSSGNTLSRDRVIDSSAGGSTVNFTFGTKDVFMMLTSEEAFTPSSVIEDIIPDSDSTRDLGSDPNSSGKAFAQTWTDEVGDPSTGDTVSASQLVQGAAKAWVEFEVDGTVNVSYNISSVVRNGTGNYTINFSTAFATQRYIATGSVLTTADSVRVINFTTQAMGSIDLHTVDSGANKTETSIARVMAVFFGAQ